MQKKCLIKLLLYAIFYREKCWGRPPLSADDFCDTDLALAIKEKTPIVI
jgi:hypothetical protein